MQLSFGYFVTFFFLGLFAVHAQANLPTFTNIKDPDIPQDFNFQGEYVGRRNMVPKSSLWGEGNFQVVLFSGGLPAAGWDQTNRSLISGSLVESIVLLRQADGNRTYLANKPFLFSATEKFPPVGQKSYSGSIENKAITLLGEDGGKTTS